MKFVQFVETEDGLILDVKGRAVMVGGNCYAHQKWQLATIRKDGSVLTYPCGDDEDDVEAVETAKHLIKKLRRRVEDTLRKGGASQIFRCAQELGVSTGFYVEK